MTEKDNFLYRTSRRTDDTDAISVNQDLNAVAARIETGRQLARIFSERFNHNLTAFRRWAKSNLDCSVESVGRYLALYSQAALLTELGVIDLVAAYKLVGADGTIKNDHPLWSSVPA